MLRHDPCLTSYHASGSYSEWVFADVHHLYLIHKTMNWSTTSLLLALLVSVNAQYFPPTPSGVTKVQSKLEQGVFVSYKEVTRGADLLLKYTYGHSLEFARQPPASNLTLDTSISLLARLMILVSSRITPSTHSSGSLNPDEILPTHHYRYG